MQQSYTAFEGQKLFSRGSLHDVALKIKRKLGSAMQTEILIFSDLTGKVIDLNFHGSEKEVLKRLEMFSTDESSKEITGPGRPKLGVVSREVSLLPSHWEWLATQSGGASASLRRLVDEAKKKLSTAGNQIKQSQESTYKFMSTLAGDLPGYEEALRALYKKDKKTFQEHCKEWPKDIRMHAIELAQPVFE